MITAVIFDYGGTMTARFESEYVLIARFFSVNPKEAREKTQESIHSFQMGKMNEDEFLLFLRKAFGYKRAIGSLEDIFGSSLVYTEPNKDMVSIVKRLKEGGYMTALLSNVIQRHVDFNRKRGNYDHFSPVILSCEAGMRKPEKGIYELTLGKMGKRPGECVFIDDLPKYIATARGLGIKTILFESPGQVREELLALGVRI